MLLHGHRIFTGYEHDRKRKIQKVSGKLYPIETGRKLNVRETFICSSKRLPNVLCTLNLRSVSRRWFGFQDFLINCIHHIIFLQHFIFFWFPSRIRFRALEMFYDSRMGIIVYLLPSNVNNTNVLWVKI